MQKNKCGMVAIVGRPNVGKSTLLNHILGQKLAITSRKPQTTRYNLLGIKTEGSIQTIYVDTPGIHLNAQTALNKHMNKAAKNALRDVDVLLFVVDRMRFNQEDHYVLEQIKQLKIPIIVAINKIDFVADKNDLLPHLTWLQEQLPNAQLVPIAALKNHNLEQLEAVIAKFLPINEHLFAEDQITNQSERFLASEIIREKIMRKLGAEIPYQVAVEIEQFKQQKKIIHISAIILVEKIGQKKIIIGDNGLKLKDIGTDARIDMEKLFASKVMLNLWVKVKAGWSDNERALRSLGF